MTKPPQWPGFRVTRPERFELPTFGSVDRRSIQLSYGRLVYFCLQIGIFCAGEAMYAGGQCRGQKPVDTGEYVPLKGPMAQIPSAATEQE